MCKEAVKKIKKNPKIINSLNHHIFPRKKDPNDFIIASIRNPYDLIVSRYHYHLKKGKQCTFEQWVNNYADETLMRFIECCYENGDVTKNMIIDYFIKLEDVEKDINNLIKLVHITTNCTQTDIHKFCLEKKIQVNINIILNTIMKN